MRTWQYIKAHKFMNGMVLDQKLRFISMQMNMNLFHKENIYNGYNVRFVRDYDIGLVLMCRMSFGYTIKYKYIFFHNLFHCLAPYTVGLTHYE